MENKKEDLNLTKTENKDNKEKKDIIITSEMSYSGLINQGIYDLTT